MTVPPPASGGAKCPICRGYHLPGYHDGAPHEYEDPRAVTGGAWSIIKDGKALRASGHADAVDWARGHVDAVRASATPIGAPIAVGRRWTLSEEDEREARRVARCQDAASGAKGSRGAGRNLDLRIKGVRGEFAVARMLGIEPQSWCEGAPPDPLTPDIRLDNGIGIEVKAGIPVVKRDHLNERSWYVTVDEGARGWTVRHVRHGSTVPGRTVPDHWKMRPGTRDLNWFLG